MKRLVILIGLVVVLGGLYFWASSQGYLDRINPAALYEARDDLKATIQGRLLLAGVIFVVIYFITVALSIPGATLLTLTGGFIFGPVLGTLLVNVGASSGAVAIFLAARYFMGSKVQEKYGDKLEKFNKEIEKNGTSYLLTLRFIPLFPFFLINLLSGFTTVKLSIFVWTTVFGIMPGSFVYANLGSAAGSLEAGRSPFTPQIIVALCLLAIVSLVPVVYRKVKARKEGTEVTTNGETSDSGESSGRGETSGKGESSDKGESSGKGESSDKGETSGE